MKKDKKNGLRAEYQRDNLGKGVRGKYLSEYHKGSNLVLLEPRLASVFKTDKSVNEALSSLVEMARHALKLTKSAVR